MATGSKQTRTTKVGAKTQGVIKTHIVRGDMVMVRRGKDKSRRGIVKSVSPRDGSAIVEGMNMVKRHMKPGQGGAQSGGIIEKEVAIPLSALMLIDPKTDAPTRVRRVRQGERSERIAVRSGAVIPAPVKG